MQELRIKGKRGQTMNLISATVIGLLSLILVVFAVFFGISALNPGSFFANNSAEQNSTMKLVEGVTGGVGQFGEKIPTLFAVLAIVLILSGIVLLILYVRRMQESAGAGRAAGL